MKKMYTSPEVELFRVASAESIASSIDSEDVPGMGGSVVNPYNSKDQNVVIVPITPSK